MLQNIKILAGRVPEDGASPEELRRFIKRMLDALEDSLNALAGDMESMKARLEALEEARR